MNIALWLQRTALAAPDAPALGHGLAVTASYGALADIVARRAAGLQQRFGLVAGDRVAVIAGNTPAYVEALYAIWHAGLAAVPVNAKLHGLEIAYILEHSGARLAFVSADLENAVAGHAPASLERLVRFGSDDWTQLAASEPAPLAPRAGSDLGRIFINTTVGQQ